RTAASRWARCSDACWRTRSSAARQAPCWRRSVRTASRAEPWPCAGSVSRGFLGADRSPSHWRPVMARNQVRLDIQRREPFAGGVSFGETGAYERLLGNAHFAIDPAEPGLPSIVDLELAPRNGAGLVEFSATLDIVKPVEIVRGRRRVLYEFSNS